MPVLLGAEETRETFAGLETWQIVLWYVLIAVSVAIFLFGVARLVLKYRRGRTKAPVGNVVERAVRTAKVVATHAWIRRRDPLSGLGHLLVFYGFVVLFIGTGILAFQDDFAEPVLGWFFWQGWFYLGYSLFLDVFGFALIVGLSVFAIKRGVLRPFRLSYWRPAEAAPPLAGEARRYRLGDWIFLGSLLFLALTGFLLESFRIAADDPSFEVWAPFGWLVGQAFIAIGLEDGAAESARAVTWWVHGVFALFWVSSIPFTKAVHMLAGPAGVAAKDDRAGNTLLPLPANAKPEEVGYATIDALAPKHLLDLDACTKCGKCHAACPATASGYPLSPRDLVLDLREVAEGSMGNRAALGIAPRFPEHADILGTGSSPRRSGRACSAWPASRSARSASSTCRSSIRCAARSSSAARWTASSSRRWRRSTRRATRSARPSGSAAAGRRSSTSTSRTRARSGPSCSGSSATTPPSTRATSASARRSPASCARHASTSGSSTTASGPPGTTCVAPARRASGRPWPRRTSRRSRAAASTASSPPTRTPSTRSRTSTRSSAAAGTVVHHSQLLLELLEAGRLRPRKGLGYRVTYHDPCTLGRYNGVYDEPRQVIESLGCELVEMPRNRDNSFCCGAGGGRIWMKELKSDDAQRPSESRIDEAVGLEAIDYFVVACPKDVTMYEDAIKTSGHQGEIELRELSELVLESLSLEGHRNGKESS